MAHATAARESLSACSQDRLDKYICWMSIVICQGKRREAKKDGELHSTYSTHDKSLAEISLAQGRRRGSQLQQYVAPSYLID